MILTINRNMASWYHVYQFDNSSSTFNLRHRDDRKWYQRSGNSCPLFNNHLYQSFLLMLKGVMQNNTHPPPKNISSIYKPLYINMNIHVLYWLYPFAKKLNEWWKRNSDHKWNWIVMAVVLQLLCMSIADKQSV